MLLLLASWSPPRRLLHQIAPPSTLLSTQGTQSLHRPTLLIAIDAKLIVVYDGTGQDDDDDYNCYKQFLIDTIFMGNLGFIFWLCLVFICPCSQVVHQPWKELSRTPTYHTPYLCVTHNCAFKKWLSLPVKIADITPCDSSGNYPLYTH